MRLRWNTPLAGWPYLQSRPTSGYRLLPSDGFMFWRYKRGAAACRLPVFHWGKVDLIGTSMAALMLPDQVGGGQFFRRLNDFTIAHLRFAGQRTMDIDDEHLSIVIESVVESEELEVIE